MDRKSNINDFVVTYLACWADAMKSLDGPEARKKLYRSGSYDGDGDCKGWTEFHLKKILYPLAEKLGYASASRGEAKSGKVYRSGNYKVDLSLYNCESEYCRSIDYAIDHANISMNVEERDGKLVVTRGGWLNEFVRMLPLNCSKARVIIGYDAFGESDWEKKKEYLLGILNNRVVRETLAETPILLILAPSCEFIDGEKDKNNLFFRIKLISKVQSGWEAGDLDELLAGNSEFLRMRREMCNVFAEIRND